MVLRAAGAQVAARRDIIGVATGRRGARTPPQPSGCRCAAGRAAALDGRSTRGSIPPPFSAVRPLWRRAVKAAADDVASNILPVLSSIISFTACRYAR